MQNYLGYKYLEKPPPSKKFTTSPQNLQIFKVLASPPVFASSNFIPVYVRFKFRFGRWKKLEFLKQEWKTLWSSNKKSVFFGNNFGRLTDPLTRRLTIWTTLTPAWRTNKIELCDWWLFRKPRIRLIIAALSLVPQCLVPPAGARHWANKAMIHT